MKEGAGKAGSCEYGESVVWWSKASCSCHRHTLCDSSKHLFYLDQLQREVKCSAGACDACQLHADTNSNRNTHKHKRWVPHQSASPSLHLHKPVLMAAIRPTRRLHARVTKLVKHYLHNRCQQPARSLFLPPPLPSRCTFTHALKRLLPSFNHRRNSKSGSG